MELVLCLVHAYRAHSSATLAARPATRAPVAVTHLRVPGMAARLGVVKLAIRSPEFGSVRDMLALSREALEGGVRHLHRFFHSVALRPGLSPWASRAADVERVYARIQRYVEGLSKLVSVRFATVSEAGIAPRPGGAEAPRPPWERLVHA